MPQLPEAIWRRRIENEFAELKSKGYSFDVSQDHTDYVFFIKGKGLCEDRGAIVPVFDHKVSLRIRREYPYAGGFELAWLTPIFHPNIDDHGKVCIQLVNQWSAGQTISSIVEALVQLLENPNPDSPLNYEAAQYVLEHPAGTAEKMKKPSRPRIL